MAPNNGRFSFGVGGYVKRLAQERNDNVPDGQVLVWRVLTSIVPILQRRLVYLASQCSDSEGPRMAPNVIGGHNVAAWPNADRGQAFNKRLASAPSARPGGRHYAKGCLCTSRFLLTALSLMAFLPLMLTLLSTSHQLAHTRIESRW